MVTTGRCFDKFYLCIKLSQRLPSEMETTAPFGLMFGLEMSKDGNGALIPDTRRGFDPLGNGDGIKSVPAGFLTGKK